MVAQVVTVAMSNPEGNCDVGDNKIIIDWISATGGAVSAGIAAIFAAANLAAVGYAALQPTTLKGFIRKVETNPGATAPTSYDLTLLDEEGYDVVAGSGAGRSATLSEAVVPSSPIYVDSELTLTIASAGDEKVGQCIIFMTKGS